MFQRAITLILRHEFSHVKPHVSTIKFLNDAYPALKEAGFCNYDHKSVPKSKRKQPHSLAHSPHACWSLKVYVVNREHGTRNY